MKNRHTKNKSIQDILSNLSNFPKFREVNKRFKIQKMLSKILLKHHMGYIVYSTIRSNKLIIMAKNHVAQVELEYQKMNLLSCLKMLKEYESIEVVSILRWDKEIRKNNLSGDNTENKEFVVRKNDEKSNGMFDNCIKNDKLYHSLEEIRNIILKK